VTVETIIDKFWERVRAHPDHVALRHKKDGAWSAVTAMPLRAWRPRSCLSAFGEQTG
jgi:hypothetical protein